MGRAYVFASRGTLPLSELASCPNHSCWVIHISVELGYVISVWGANIPRACFGNLTEVRCGTHISHLQAGEPIRAGGVLGETHGVKGRGSVIRSWWSVAGGAAGKHSVSPSKGYEEGTLVQGLYTALHHRSCEKESHQIYHGGGRKAVKMALNEENHGPVLLRHKQRKRKTHLSESVW